MSASPSSSSSPSSLGSESEPHQIPAQLPPLPRNTYGASGIERPPRPIPRPPRLASQQGSFTTAARPLGHTFSEFLQSNPYPSQPALFSTDGERQRALDRKRRLTGSTPDHRRRRDTPAGREQHRLDHNETLPDATQREVIDLTGSSPPPPPPPPHDRPSRTSSSSSRMYVVPPWQPDSEVSECPICKRPFTWMFRRHHCRKCGRVVCNDCSPHRITIPRQFIVNPPGPQPVLAESQPAVSSQVEVVDLTGEEGDAVNPSISTSGGTRIPANLHVDGGEKVRLCNPCVPDPQPEPLPNFPPFMDAPDTELIHSGGRGFSRHASSRPGPVPTNVLGQPSRSSSLFPRSAQDPRVTGSQSYTSSYLGRPRHTSLVDPYTGRPLMPPPGFGRSNSPEGRSFFRPRAYGNTSAASSDAMQGLPFMPGHARYQSLDSMGRGQSDHDGRPRVRSMINPGFQYPRGMFASPSDSRPQSHSQSQPSVVMRPRVHETDICPICRRLLPPRGADGDETDREAHIVACISARDPATSSGQASSSRGLIRMVSFTANEKDCVGEDGSTQECSICMVEYDVGEKLARLECLCKFHKECIVSWLNRKAECPVHKASEMHMT